MPQRAMALQINAQLSTMRIGYFRMKYFRPLPGIEDALYADNRRLLPDHIKSLASDFEFNGVENCSLASVIHIVAPPAHFNAEAARPSIDGLTILDVPPLEIGEEGKIAIQLGTWKIKGGQHRFKALEAYLIKLEQAVLDAQVKADRIEKKSKKSVDDEDELVALQSFIVMNKAKIAVDSQWTVCMYNKGARGSILSTERLPINT